MKRSFDILFSFFAISILSPLFLVICIAIKLTSKGPCIFRQERIGLNLSHFTILKFRTMILGAQNLGDGLYSYHDDFRVTPIGHILRKSSLDELPQLFNILFGHMSLIGPRPPVVDELGDVSDFPPYLVRRFNVKPGLTGLAQISGRNALNWSRKIAYDLLYIRLYKSCPLYIDCFILFKTIFIVLTFKNVVETK